jgi:serine/threonine protein kinase
MASIPTVTEVNLTKDITTGNKYLNNFRLLSKLGNGQNGKVYLAQNSDDSTQYAIKEISKVTKLSITNKDPKSQMNSIQNEIEIMTLILRHPKIVRLYQVLDDAKFNKVFLILEYCAQGELKFGASHKYSLQEIRTILRDVILGLEYLHGIGIIHRDIKPSNLLMYDDNKNVKISDFGVSLNRNNNIAKINTLGTPAFLAPELCNGSMSKDKESKIDGQVDVWALGITIYCVWFQRLPFNGQNEYELFNEIIYTNIEIPEGQSEEERELVGLLRRMLQKDPKIRINIKEMKNDPFVTMDLTPATKTEFIKFNDSYILGRNADNLSRTESLQRKFRSMFRRRSSAAANESPSFIISPVLPETSHQQEYYTPMSAPPSAASLPSMKWRSLKSSTLASSSNSLNLNSLLRSKKDVPDYLDDSTYYEGMDSDGSSSSDEDTDDSDEDGLYNEEDTLSFRIGPKRANSSSTMKTMHDYLDI